MPEEIVMRHPLPELEALDRAHFFHPSTQLAAHARGETPVRIVTGGEGSWITFADGRRCLDAFAGLYCVNVGYGRSEIADAIARQAQTLAYYHAYAGHGSEAAIELAARLVERAPAGIARVYFGLSGSDANETQLKIIRYYNNVLGRPRKKKVIARNRAYHGSGLATGSLTGLPLFHAQFDLPLDFVRHVRCPHWWREAAPGESERDFSRRLAAELEELILAEGPETVAAFFAEPVMGTGGLIPPPEGYFEEIGAVLRRHDVLFVADEVVTAFGRLGAWFGCERYGIEPDLVTVAKGLTSAYLPLSAVLVSERVARVLDEGCDRFGPFGHGWTYSAHPLCCAAAHANLDILEREDLPGRVREIGPYLLDRLRAELADHPIVGEVRGAGLLAAVEFAADPRSRRPFDPALGVGARVAAALFARGVIARAMPHGDILGFAPPLVLTREEADLIAGETRAAVEEVARTLPAA